MKNLEEQFLDKIKKEVKEIYKDKLDLYLITPDKFNGLNEKVPVICKKCNEITWITPQDLLEGKFECKYCKEIKRYKYIVYILKKKLDGFEFDYSTIDINNPDAIYTVRCLRCGKISRFTLKELSSKYFHCDRCFEYKSETDIDINCSDSSKIFSSLDYISCSNETINFLKKKLSTKFDNVFDLTKLTSKDVKVRYNTIRLYSFSNRKFKEYDLDEIIKFNKQLIPRSDKNIYYTRLKRLYGDDFIVPDIRKDDFLCSKDKIKLVCKKCGKVYKETIPHLMMRYDKLECKCIRGDKIFKTLNSLKSNLRWDLHYRFDISSITNNLLDSIITTNDSIITINDNINTEVDIKCKYCGESFKVCLKDLLFGYKYSDCYRHNCGYKKIRKK